MAGDTRIFKMTNEGIYLNDRESIPYSKTNLPIKYFSFTNVRSIYWLVKPKVVVEQWQQVILVDVLDYHVHDLRAFIQQKIEREVHLLKFQNINWNEFVGQVASYSPNKLKGPPFIFPAPKVEEEDSSLRHKNLFEIPPATYSKDTTQAFNTIFPNVEMPTPKEWVVNISVRKNLTDLEIKDGFAQVVHQAQEIGEEVLIKVYNDVLRSEYDLIKAYFANKLGRKTVQINATVKLLGNRVLSVEAISPEIAAIDQSFLEVIRRRQIQAMRNMARVKADKGLYTIEEVADGLEEAAGRVFNYSLDDIIQVLTDDYKHRNSKQIKYLSEQHKALDEVVRLTLKPNFGFVFFLAGEANIHYVWELLNSHATYIWSFPKTTVSKENSLSSVEMYINEIEERGRNYYKTQLKAAGDNKFIYLEHKISDDGQSILFEHWHRNLCSIIKT